MSDKKAVFFDADGTICDMEKGVPDSAVESIKKLVANGHQAWLCTGRSRAFVSRYLEEVPFTGIISACGATIEKDGKRLYNNERTPEVAKLSVEILRKYGLIPVCRCRLVCVTISALMHISIIRTKWVITTVRALRPVSRT